MIADKACAEKRFDAPAGAGLMKCDICHRELRTSAEWICSDRRVICDICYKNLLNPNPKIRYEE